MRSTVSSVFMGTAISLCLPACGGEPGTGSAADAPAYTSTDSAGVELAVTTFADPPPAVGWTIAAEPSVVFGEVGERTVEFSWIRDAFRLADGRVIAIDGPANTIFFFAPTGELQATAGGEGDGPGEFRRINGIAHVGGDTMVAYAPRHRRLSLFDLSGEHLGDQRLEDPQENDEPAQLGLYGLVDVHSASVVLTGQGFGFRRGETEEFAFSNPTLLYALDGRPMGPVGEPARFWLTPTGGSLSGTLFGGYQRIDARGGRIYVNDRSAFEVRVHGLEGGLLRIHRLARARRPVTDEMVDRVRDWRAKQIDDPEERKVMIEHFGNSPVADSVAWIDRARVDALGNVWVLESSIVPDDKMNWSVFSAEGPWLGRVEVPSGVNPLEIGEDYLLAVVTDELDVNHLALFDLER